MKEKILCAIGIILITIAIILIAIPNNNEKNKKEYEIKVNKESLIEEKIEIKKYKNYKWEKLEESYIKDRNIEDKTLYTFLYPTDLKEEFLDEYNKLMYSSKGLTLEIYDTSEFNIEEYINNTKKEYEDLKHTKFNYKIKDKINISGYDAGYIFIQSINEEEYEANTGLPIYEEKYLIYINMNSKKIIFEYTLENKVFTDVFLMEMINGIKIEKGKAKYTTSTVKNNNLVGTIKQNKLTSSKNGYSLSYTLDNNKYQEIETNTNNYNIVNFKLINDETYIDYKIIISAPDMDLVSTTVNALKTKYSNEELYKLHKFDESTFDYNGKSFHKITIHFKDLKTSSDKYYVQVIELLDEFAAASTHIISNKEITKTEIHELLNYKTDKY